MDYSPAIANAETKRNAIKEFIDKIIVKSKLVSMLMILIHGFSLIKVKSDVHIYNFIDMSP